VRSTAWLGVLLLLLLPASVSRATTSTWLHKHRLARVNAQLCGTVIDYTHNHGADRRIWSPALCQYRDLYVYLPPGFDPDKRYPLLLWLHGFAQDEQSFLADVIPPLDQAISCGKLPPLIIAAPDGSLSGEPCFLTAGSFFVNSDAGRFQDYITQDVWNFLFDNYPLLPEREAHVVAGVSMGGGAAYNLAIKFRERFKVVVGIFPPLNSRWIDCHGNTRVNFDPCCWGWRTDYSRPHEVVGRFYGVILITMKRVAGPLYGFGPDVAARVSAENPIELIDRLDLRPGELSMYVGYGGKDQFNIDAQVESFLHRAKERGLCLRVGYVPDGKHDRETARKLLPGLLEWLSAQMAAYQSLR
jgi:S-formylglutathione hydrolase FrmB